VKNTFDGKTMSRHVMDFHVWQIMLFALAILLNYGMFNIGFVEKLPLILNTLLVSCGSPRKRVHRQSKP
jgi:hypothetical protein